MVFRRRTPPPPPPPSPKPEWERRFDAAVELIGSQPGPVWIEDRLRALEAALRRAEADDRRLTESIERLGPDTTAAELKEALRRRGPSVGDDDLVERRISALRQRYETIHDLMNRRDAIVAQMVATVSDLELLAVQAVHDEAMRDIEPGAALDAHLERLDLDMQALATARREVELL